MSGKPVITFRLCGSTRLRLLVDSAPMTPESWRAAHAHRSLPVTGEGLATGTTRAAQAAAQSNRKDGWGGLPAWLRLPGAATSHNRTK